jgi:serine/threonine protein kinase
VFSYSPNPFSSLKKAASILEQIESCALGIACGMEYLHQNEIILRHLKPENIGFDALENVKLFDFGMARHLQDISEQGIAGSLRYMAPETVLAIGSNTKSDVYSLEC